MAKSKLVDVLTGFLSNRRKVGDPRIEQQRFGMRVKGQSGEDDQRLHIGDDDDEGTERGDADHEQIVRKALASIEQEIRDLNSNDPEAANKMICAGCAASVIMGMKKMLVWQANMTFSDAERFYGSMVEDDLKMAFVAARAVKDGYGDERIAVSPEAMEGVEPAA
jgi:hypothetical protein